MRTNRWFLLAALSLISASASAAPAPYAQQGAKLVGTGVTGVAYQGFSVAVSADGNTAIVGGYNDNSGIGAAWVYTRSSGAWTQQGAKLVGTGSVGTTPSQGYSVAMSADGNTAIVGGYGDNATAGAAWVYTRSGGVWTQQGAKLVGTGAVGAAAQGISVALSADGNTAIMGGSGDNSNAGAAWVFTRSGGVWTQQGAKLVGTGAVGSPQQGKSVALSADGNTALLGGPNDNTFAGAAWVFTRSGGVWTQQGAKLVGTGAAGPANQGYGVAVSGDGNTAGVGGYNDNGNTGAVWIYTRSGGVWTQQGAKLVGAGTVGTAGLGLSVALSSDGNTVVVGGNGDNSLVGAAWIFTRSSGVWTQPGAKLVGTGAVGSSQQGRAVGLSADGKTVLVSGNGDNGFTGAAWVYVNPSPAIVAIADVPNDQGGKVSLRWTASLLDNAPGNTVDAYWIWRQVPIQSALAALARGATLVSTESAVRAPASGALRATREAAEVYYWEYVGSQVSHGFPAYSYTAPTTSDSVPVSNPYTIFMVEAERLSTGDYWGSPPDSGYSVDNLPPGPPAPVAAAYSAGATHIHWGANAEADFAVYRLYRGASAGFVPGPGNLVTSQPDTGYADAGSAGSYYKLSAVDIHGNESAFALITPGTTAGVDDGPLVFALDRLRNPSRGGRLNVTFALPSDARATLEVVDVSGRRAAAREVGALGAGRHAVEIGAGSRLAAGIYFVRLTQGTRVAITRVAVLE